MDPLYLSVLVSAEKRCVQSGEVPHLINAEPSRPRIEAIRIVAARRTRGRSSPRCSATPAMLFSDHERAKSELKELGAGGCQ
jgi:hypothetical protein